MSWKSIPSICALLQDADYKSRAGVELLLTAADGRRGTVKASVTHDRLNGNEKVEQVGYGIISFRLLELIRYF